MGLLSRLVADFSGDKPEMIIPKAIKAPPNKKRKILDSRYEIGTVIGKGVTCHVFAGVDIQDQSPVAIKRINDPFFNRHYAKAFMKEIAIMRHLPHPNHLSLRDVVIHGHQEREVFLYLVTDRQKTNLRLALQKHRDYFRPLHLKYFMFQIVHGLKYMHECGIAHRDIKPSNILVDKSGIVKICDFGLSTGMLDPDAALTNCVVTRYFRSPQLLLGSTSYSYDIDMWALGCTFVEILTGQVLFPGRDDEDQLQVIVDCMGVPPDQALPLRMPRSSRRALIRVTGRMERCDRMDELLRSLDPQARDLITQLIRWEPERRLSAADALLHPFFHEVPQHYPSLFPLDMPPCAEPFIFALEHEDISAENMVLRGLGEKGQYAFATPHPFGAHASDSEGDQRVDSCESSSGSSAPGPLNCYCNESKYDVCRHRQRSVSIGSP
jgi:p38 MAP kinase